MVTGAFPDYLAKFKFLPISKGTQNSISLRFVGLTVFSYTSLHTVYILGLRTFLLYQDVSPSISICGAASGGLLWRISNYE